MPAKEWTTKEDWEGWVWTDEDLETAPGSVLIAEGMTMATGTSPTYECASYAHHSRAVAGGSLPVGTNIIFRYQIGATQSACEEADWSDWFNLFDAEGVMRHDLLVDMLNRGIDPAGKSWVRYQVRLYRA